MSKRFFKLGLCTLVISMFLLSGCSSNAGGSASLAKVGNSKITKEIVDKEISFYLGIQNQVLPDIKEPGAKQYITNLENSSVKYLAETEALYQEAKKQNFTLEQKKIDDYYKSLEEFVTSSLGQTMDEFFKQNKLTEAYLKDSIKKQMYSSEFALSKVTVNEKEMKEFYDNNKDLFTTVQASHILISNENESLPEDSKAGANSTHTHDDGTIHKDLTKEEEAILAKNKSANLAKANEVLKKAKEGTDFTKLSDQYSDDTVAKEQGGDLGTFEKGSMVEEFEKVVFNPELKVGQLYDKVLPTTYGYHIIKKTGEKHLSYEEVKDRIKNEILLPEKVTKYTKKVATDYNITYAKSVK